LVVDPKTVLADVMQHDIDQIAVFARMKGGIAIWSSHPVQEFIQLIDDGTEALENDTMLDPEDGE
jgi:hypothetical protein